MSTVVRTLRDELSEIVYERGDEEYVAATSPHNSSFPQEPCAVVRPLSPEHIARTVTSAGKFGAAVVVQSTGHGAGRPLTDNHVLLDTSAMSDVTVQPTAGIAQVGAGVTWPSVQEEAWRHQLLGLSGTSPTVGVPGYVFGGGVGWLVRRHGLAAGALRSVDYVDGTGRLRRASADAGDPSDREALWAFRGGAPCGVATSVEIALFPVADLWTGYLLWPADALPAVAAAWAAALETVSDAVTSSLALLRLPPEGPFPERLQGTRVVHLSYASLDGEPPLRRIRDAVHRAVIPAVDTTGPGDVQSLSAIHLDPPSAVPARGTGRWLGRVAAGLVEAIFGAAKIGQSNGLNMIELRHTATLSVGPDGALATVPEPFLLHAVGAAGDDDYRTITDDVLRDVEAASRGAGTGRAARSFCDGRSEVEDAFPASDLDRLRRVRVALDPYQILAF